MAESATEPTVYKGETILCTFHERTKNPSYYECEVQRVFPSKLDLGRHIEQLQVVGGVADSVITDTLPKEQTLQIKLIRDTRCYISEHHLRCQPRYGA